MDLLSLKVDGGMTMNNLVMQFQSDLLDVQLRCPLVVETTALGAAFAAGLAVGYWKSMSELKMTWKQGRSWNPVLAADLRASLMLHWRKAVARSLFWVDDAKGPEDVFLKALEPPSSTLTAPLAAAAAFSSSKIGRKEAVVVVGDGVWLNYSMFVGTLLVSSVFCFSLGYFFRFRK